MSNLKNCPNLCYMQKFLFFSESQSLCLFTISIN